MTTEQAREYVTMLEGRRLNVDAIMWQTPTITVLGQTFLLTIVTDDSVDRTTSVLLAAAGVCMTAMAVIVLAHQRLIETAFSDRISELATTKRGLDDPRNTTQYEGFARTFTRRTDR